MSAEKPIITQVADHRKMWRELWWAMADANIGNYAEVKRMEVLEFWAIFDKWREKITEKK